MDRLVFHIDVNSAFLSWEAAKRVANGEPDLRLIPSVIGGDPQKRTGIVVAKSIPAKKYGITTGEPMSMAVRKCPGLVSVAPDFSLYIKNSRAFKAICKEYTPTMESFSIDEVFIDMSGMKNIYPDPIKTAYEIKDRIRDELGFTVNVGIARNKVCAKMASDFEKPDKVHTLFPEEIPEKMWPLPVGDLFTCGKSSANKLVAANIKTIGELANADLSLVKMLIGDKQGQHLHDYANGIDDDPVTEIREEAKGYSAETTVEDDLDSLDKINKMLMAQADVVAARMRREDAKCRCVSVTFRNLDFVTRSHQKKLSESTDVTEVIYDVARKLIAESWNGEPLRLIGLALTDIDREGFEQMSFIVDDRKEKMKKLDNALDSLRVRFGDDSVKRAGTMDVAKRVNRKHRAENNVTDDDNENNDNC
ncbi:MAG: DNA polymerase IV [Lachnospiraceae bacterium]|nr:DNA polymerase IV [Lachnospiraceae bacterium]